MRINLEKIKRLSGETKKALTVLKSYAALPVEEIINDPVKLDRIKYNFIVAIQSIIDMCYHIIAKKGDYVPEDYADCFKFLAKLGVIDEDFAKRLAQMAKFRNLLVHLYWEVNSKRVCQILKENITNFEEFLSCLKRFLSQEESFL